MIKRIVSRNLQRLRPPFFYASVLLLSAFSFTQPGRPTDSPVDTITILKVGVCLIVGTWSLLDVLWHSQWRLSVIVWAMAPMGLFLSWACLSVAWSPIQVISAGQICCFASLVLLCCCIAVGCRSMADASRIFTAMSAALLWANGMLIGVHVLRPDLSGFARVGTLDGADGFMNPTAAAANASLGLLATCCGFLIWPSTTRTFLTLPALIVHGVVLGLASNRTSIALMLVMLPAVFVVGFRRDYLAYGVVASSAVALTFVLIDPGFSSFRSVVAGVTDIAYRGETHEQLMTLNGRTLLWAAVWEEFEKAPLLGHGYFSTSERGAFYVWGRMRNHTAHNLVIQILVSTGVVGLCLFAWGLLRPLRLCLWHCATSDSWPIRATGCLMLLWYSGWSQLCVTFVGAVRTESMVFFVVLGILMATVIHELSPAGVSA